MSHKGYRVDGGDVNVGSRVAWIGHPAFFVVVEIDYHLDRARLALAGAGKHRQEQWASLDQLVKVSR